MKSKFVGFRLEEPLYDFLHSWSKSKNMTVTDVVRNLCTFMYVGCSMNRGGKFNIKVIFSDTKRKKNFNMFIRKIAK